MKKFFLFLSSVLVIFSLSACLGGGAKVVQMEFNVDDGPVPPQYFSVSKLVVEPNYEESTLSINYSVVYPDRTEETEEEDIQTTSIVGDSYFVRFEELSGLVKNYEGSDLNLEDHVGAGNFSVSISNSKEVFALIDTLWSDDNSDVKALRDFYLELVNLLAGDVQV